MARPGHVQLIAHSSLCLITFPLPHMACEYNKRSHGTHGGSHTEGPLATLPPHSTTVKHSPVSWAHPTPRNYTTSPSVYVCVSSALGVIKQNLGMMTLTTWHCTALQQTGRTGSSRPWGEWKARAHSPGSQG